MAGKPGTWAKGQKPVKSVDLGDGTTAEGVIIVDTAGNPVVGTGGGAATVADGADVAQGTTSDVAWVSGSGTVISLLKKIASAGGSAVSVADGADAAQGTTTDLSSANTVVGLLKAIKAAITGTLTVSGPVTDTQIRATPLPVSGTVTATTGGLTDTQLRATPVPVSGTVATGALTDTQLRATPVPVSGTVTATTGGLTDTQLRATPVPVSGSVTATTGGLTDTQLRATPVPVSGTVTANVGTVPVTFTESATAAEAGALPALEKVVSGYDRGTAAVRALSMATINGDYRLMVDDARLKKQINQTNLLLMEIVDLLKEQRT